ncbi:MULTISPECIES: SDR family NAD(P)-dependent oxidoreductase [Komagataeibacter]|uniref:SDR family NAD(P)-dependent oxidoreductase n=1 Tax=Komagataeibacter TaxID=1434011 RepID=UPI000C84A3E9|nr:SDR family NAD(P)-dependent oxidoreductase [Komagataeibacter saccharivorans]
MSTSFERRPIAVIAGAGPGNGQAIARRFADAGYVLALLGRNAEKTQELAKKIPQAVGYGCDVSDSSEVSSVFSRIRSDLGAIDVLVFNAGSAIFADIETVTAEQFEASWRVNALGGLLCSQAVIPEMIARGTGHILFIGATASRRGGAQMAAFAPAKAAQRSLAESMARQLWPKGVHVALIIIDGIVDTPATRAYVPDRPVESLVSPDAVAHTAYELTRQDHRGWSFEVEVRPFLEKW